MSSRSQQTIYLKDYKEPAFDIENVDLRFDIYDDHTQVTNLMRLNKKKDEELVLDGVGLKLISLKLNGEEVTSHKIEEEGLRIADVPEKFELEVVTQIFPHENKSYEGLYFSKNTLVTQMEAQGFRKVTYFIDRPDVMSSYKTTITASKEKYPHLLSNGNLIREEELTDGRHLATWEDPHVKPCYLFALVAGDLGLIRDEFTTSGGRKVDLRIYSERGAENRCYHAMDALKKSMKWDEERYGLEYDLDIYMIVAVDDFNAGAMENKGLNIFNSIYVLADEKTATDTDYDKITAVIGHEYFHNWTGNRVTLRDWFQLSLKEGLTVYRDQEFSSDLASRAVQRIDDVNMLRNRQFAEDAGPTAHPVRPSAVISVDNFFTVTIYEKGAELIRMYETLLGREGFRKGMDLYFQRHDGQSVTIDDFAASMADANGADLTQFKLWYDQAGTPRIKASGSYNAEKNIYELTLEQSCPETPEQKNKKPFHIPVRTALLDRAGKTLDIGARGEKEKVLHLKGSKQTFVFENVNSEPVPSLLRGFSAPVHLDSDYTAEDLAFLYAHDNDSFSRWEAGQTLLMQSMLDSIRGYKENGHVEIPELIAPAFQAVLANEDLDPSFKARLLVLPEESYVGQFMETVDVDAIHTVRSAYRKTIAENCEELLQKLYEQNRAEKYEIDALSIGRRSLKNISLSFLNATEKNEWQELALKQLKSANNMTDEITALNVISHSRSDLRREALDHFENKWKNESLVMNKLLRTVATSPLSGTLEEVQNYMKSSIFNADNPNKVYALIMGFGQLNPTQFHAEDGRGYEFIAEQVLVFDEKNPHVASYLAGAFNHWKKFDSKRQDVMKNHLERIKAKNGLSGNTFEIISKNLNA